MRRTITIPALGRPDPGEYQPTYRESAYQRPLWQRLTPLSRFMLILGALGALAMVVALVTNLIQSANGTELLSERLYGRGAAEAEPTRAPAPAIQVVFLNHPDAEAEASAQASAEGQAGPASAQAGQAAAAQSTPAPTADPNRAPWADQLVKQADGTLMAPQAVIVKIVEDLSGYYAMQRDLPLDDFLAKREWMLTTFFAGQALEEMRKLEQSRDLYGMYHSGRLTIEVRNFSPDGFRAKAGVITRDWVSDVYDVASKQLVAKGRVKKDALTVMTIVFDQASERWKFTAVEEVVELQP